MNLDQIESIVITDKDGKTIFEMNENEYMCAEGYDMRITSKVMEFGEIDYNNWRNLRSIKTCRTIVAIKE